MKFRFPNKSAEEKIAAAQAEMDRLEQWHDHFAWLPRRTSEKEFVWFDYVERKGTAAMIVTDADTGNVTIQWRWEYREKPSKRHPFHQLEEFNPANKEKLL